MIEFSEDLKHKYTEQRALRERVLHRLRFEKHVVPFTLYGVDYSLFSLGSAAMLPTLNKMFADMDTRISFEGRTATIAGITVDLQTLEAL